MAHFRRTAGLNQLGPPPSGSRPRVEGVEFCGFRRYAKRKKGLPPVDQERVDAFREKHGMRRLSEDRCVIRKLQSVSRRKLKKLKVSLPAVSMPDAVEG